MTYQIRRVAVLGAGTMGAAIAAQVANAGLTVDLLDMAPGELTPEEESKGLSLASPAVRNRIVKAGFERMRKAKPAALMSDQVAGRVRLGNFEDDFERVGEADWVLEAIVEKLEPKQALMARIEQVRTPDSIISSNTSGIPLSEVAAGCSEGFRRHFLGTHFFNPPRYLKLLELIPTAGTDPAVVDYMRSFARHVLGKGVVIARDTPNFIANRLGSYAGMQAMRYTLDNGYDIEEVDALTGPLVGRPQTAIYRLADQVGLDVMLGVAENLYDLVPEDESREALRVPQPLSRMREAGLLGIKTGSGFYQRTRRDSETVFDVIDLDSLAYRPAHEPKLPIIAEARKQGDLGTRLRFLLSKAHEDRGARYLRDTLLPSLAYAARRAPEMAGSLVDIDHAMEWGYGHQAGPFRTWDLLGVPETVAQMDALGIEVAPWVRTMLEQGDTTFYREEDGRELAYSPATGTYAPVPLEPEGIDLDRLRSKGREVARNDSASLLDLGDGVLCLEIHSRNSTLDGKVMEMGRRALLELAGNSWAGLVIANQAENFCVGANLGEIAAGASPRGSPGGVEQVGQAVDALQDLLMGFRFSARPVVAAPHGRTLGGGAEIVLAADRVVAAAETYMGLVEVGVGLIPAGGGCKEMLRRVVSPAMAIPGTPPLPFVQKAFEAIAMAKVSTSAMEAREMGILTPDDRIVMNPDYVLAAAKREVLDMAPAYRPPAGGNDIYAAGRSVRAALDVGVRQLQWGRFATEYDGVIAERLAGVLCGGNLSAPQWVSEEYILRLERDAFLALLGNQKTQARIEAMLKTGKPLRN